METEDEKWLRLATVNVGWDHTCDTRTGTMSMDQHGELVYELTRLRAELEIERMRLAACSTAALGYNDPPLERESPYWSASLGDIMRLRAELAEAKKDGARLDWLYSGSCGSSVDAGETWSMTVGIDCEWPPDLDAFRRAIDAAMEADAIDEATKGVG